MSGVWRINQEDMVAYFKEFIGSPQHALAYRDNARAEHATTAKKKSAYVTSIPMQTKAVMLRRLQVLKGNAAAQIVNTVAFLVEAVVVGTVFFQIQNTTATVFSRGSVLYLFVTSFV